MRSQLFRLLLDVRLTVALAATLCLLLSGAAGAQTAASLAAPQPPAGCIALETLNLNDMSLGWGSPGRARSVGNNPLTLGGIVFPHGIGTHAESRMTVDLHGVATRFEAAVGIDDETQHRGAASFEVVVDGKQVASTEIMHGGDPPRVIDIDLTGAKRMELIVHTAPEGIAYAHADWCGAFLWLEPGATTTPQSVAIGTGPPRLTIPAENPRPAFHGPRITGATPGHPFLFLIPATGQPPLVYSASNLPAGLKLDARTGIITGRLLHLGRTVVALAVRNRLGVAHRNLTIVGNDHALALTPPMGWNSWNVWAGAVDEPKVRAAADVLAAGLARCGYQYVNIDDTWAGDRDASGATQSNSKFPDMAALAAYVHGKGLKIGIYSSPGPTTCAGYTGSYQHELQDAQTYAEWGFDYLKYDWCSYGSIAGDNSRAALEKPYIVMGDDLRAQDRDIVFSLCQYGMGDVWEWGADVHGNLWRTTGDIQDNWNSLLSIYNAQDGLYKYAGPGHWNDPDMLMVGIVGFGATHPTHLTPNEQITHISMWCMFAAPLLIGCDMTRLDPFTRALLTNDEMLDINQDSLGQEARRVVKSAGGDVWVRPLADGTKAVALVNTSDDDQTVTLRWPDIGLTGPQPVRDLWLHKNVGAINGQYSVLVPAHGTVVLKIGRPSPSR